MQYHAGIDVSLEQSSVGVVDAAGKIVKEAKVTTDPQVPVTFFKGLSFPVTRIGLEGDRAQSLAAIPVVCRSSRASGAGPPRASDGFSHVETRRLPEARWQRRVVVRPQDYSVLR